MYDRASMDGSRLRMGITHVGPRRYHLWTEMHGPKGERLSVHVAELTPMDYKKLLGRLADALTRLI